MKNEGNVKNMLNVGHGTECPNKLYFKTLCQILNDRDLDTIACRELNEQKESKRCVKVLKHYGVYREYFKNV